MGISKTVLPILALLVIYFILPLLLAWTENYLFFNNCRQKFEFPYTNALYYTVFHLVVAGLIRYACRFYTGKSRVEIDLGDKIKFLAPAGIMTGVAIGISTWDFEMDDVPLSLMVASSTITYTLFFSILFGLEKKSWTLMVTVVIISLGLCISSYNSHELNPFKMSYWCVIIFIVSASVIIAIRWTLAQSILQNSKLCLDNPIDFMYFLQPWMILPIFLFALSFEGVKLLEALSMPVSSYGVMFVLKLTIGACIAFTLDVTQYLLLSHTSSLTISICLAFRRFGIPLVLFYLNLYKDISMFRPEVFLIGVVSYIIYKCVSSKDENISTITGGSEITDM